MEAFLFSLPKTTTVAIAYFVFSCQSIRQLKLNISKIELLMCLTSNLFPITISSKAIFPVVQAKNLGVILNKCLSSSLIYINKSYLSSTLETAPDSDPLPAPPPLVPWFKLHCALPGWQERPPNWCSGLYRFLYTIRSLPRRQNKLCKMLRLEHVTSLTHRPWDGLSSHWGISRALTMA